MSNQPTPQQADVCIYVDGHTRDGAGGYGAVLVSQSGKTKTLTGADRDTTAARMELLSVNQALDCLEYACTVQIYSDNKNIVNGGNEWVYKWVRNGWRTSRGRLKTHITLWKDLLTHLNQHDITFQYVSAAEKPEALQRANQLAWATRNQALLDHLREQEHVFLLAGTRQPTAKMEADAATLVETIHRLPDIDPEKYGDGSKPWIVISDRSGFDEAVIRAANQQAVSRIAVIGSGASPQSLAPKAGHYIQHGRGRSEHADILADIATRGYFVHDDNDSFTETTYQALHQTHNKPAVMWHQYSA